jgi:hypothetical protein
VAGASEAGLLKFASLALSVLTELSLPPISPRRRERQQRQVNEAAEKFAESLTEAYRSVAGRSVSA